ncbi:molecular chaperone MKKS [Pelodytes ibericus]
MSSFVPKKQSLCTTRPLSANSIKEALSVFQGIVTSCYGPTGRLKQLHNGTGGCVLTTSQSFTLLSGFSVSHPVLKLLVASMRNHVTCVSDCGLFASILCCNLIDRFLSLNISPRALIGICKNLLATCINYLNAEDCACRMTVDFSSTKALLSLTYTVISSKPACMLTVKEVDYVSTLIVKAFLLSIPNEIGSSVHLGKSIIVPAEGQNVMESTVVPGLLIEMAEFSWDRAVPSSGLPTANIKLALFSISLCGDLCDTGEGTVGLLSGVNPEHVMLDQLFNLAKQLVHNQVNCVVCQKVIHPSLKLYFKDHYILAVDRLGAALMEPLSQMTGASPIASLSLVSSTCYGSLRALSRLSHGSKSYFHLIPFDSSVSSIVLCNRNETSLKELTTICKAAQHVLQLTLKKPWVLLGGGCTETHLAAFLRYKSVDIPSTLLKELDCSAAQYQLVADRFCISLEACARSLEHDDGQMSVDLQEGHVWSIPPDATSETGHQCGCGMHRTRDSLTWSMLGSQYKPFDPQSCTEKYLSAASDRHILDCFTAKCNGLQVAVDTAGLILDLSYVVEDQN